MVNNFLSLNFRLENGATQRDSWLCLPNMSAHQPSLPFNGTELTLLLQSWYILTWCKLELLCYCEDFNWKRNFRRSHTWCWRRWKMEKSSKGMTDTQDFARSSRIKLRKCLESHVRICACFVVSTLWCLWYKVKIRINKGGQRRKSWQGCKRKTNKND